MIFIFWHSICYIKGKDKGKNMAGFKFALEKVLQYKEQLENEVKAKLADLGAKKQMSENRLAGLKQDELFQEQKLSKTPVHETGERWLIDNYIKAIRQDIQQTQKTSPCLIPELNKPVSSWRKKQKTEKLWKNSKKNTLSFTKKEEQLKEQ